MGRINDLLSDYIRYEEFAPGISIALIKNDKCIYKKSHGFANLENEIGINSKTAFYIASLSKSFTAAAVMLLEEKGKLNLTDRINKYFQDLPEYCADIKIIHLINHTSGLKDYFNSYLENRKNINFITNSDVYKFILTETSFDFPPGEKFQYSNTGYVLLSLLIEKVSEQSFSDFLQDNFFSTLGMENTYVYTEKKPIIQNRAYGYAIHEDKYVCDDYYVLTTGDGGIYSCIDDLILWVQAFDSEIIFSKHTVEKIFTRGQLNNGNLCIYASGWFTLEKDSKQVVFHSGQLGGFTNIMIKLPEENFSIIILTNCYRDSLQRIFKSVHDCIIEANAQYYMDKPIN